MKLTVLAGLALFATTIDAAEAETYLFSRYTSGVLQDVAAYDTVLGQSTAAFNSSFSIPVHGYFVNAPINSLQFYSGDPNFNDGGYSYYVGGSQQLYTGTTANPVFTPGTYDLSPNDPNRDDKFVIQDVTDKQVYLFQINSSAFTGRFLVSSADTFTPKSGANQYGTGGFTVSGISGGDSYGKPVTEAAFSNYYNQDPQYTNGLGSVDSIVVNGKVVYAISDYNSNVYNTSGSGPLFRYNEDARGNLVNVYSAPRADNRYVTVANPYDPADQGSLRIVQLSAGISSAVPEPATWAYMVIGVGCVGGAMRLNRRRSASVLG